MHIIIVCHVLRCVFSHVIAAMVTRVGRVVATAVQAGARIMREAAAKRRPKPLLMLTQPETLALDQELLPRTLRLMFSLAIYTLSQCVVSL